MRRVKYNRANLESTIKAANKIKADNPVYIFATFEGYTISNTKPPFGQKYIEV